MSVLYITADNRSRKRPCRSTASLFLHNYPAHLIRRASDSTARREHRYECAERDYYRMVRQHLRGDHTVSVTPRPDAPPELAGSSWQLSIASCDSMFALLFSPSGCPLAVDIERNRVDRDFRALAELSLSGNERLRYLRVNSDRRILVPLFYRYWTVSEAVSKLGHANILADAPLVDSEHEVQGHSISTGKQITASCFRRKPACRHRSRFRTVRFKGSSFGAITVRFGSGLSNHTIDETFTLSLAMKRTRPASFSRRRRRCAGVRLFGAPANPSSNSPR